MSSERTIIEQVNLREILHEEIAAMETYHKSKAKFIEQQVLSAAKKLEEYVEDKSTICNIITKFFHKDFERDIRRVCLPEYKQSYMKDEDYIKILDEFDELFTHMADVGASIQGIALSIKAKYRESTKEEREGLMAFVIEIFGSFAELKKRLEEWRDLSVECARIKQMHDDRTKMDAFTKFMLRIQSFHISKNRLAELNDISSKWVRTGIINDQALEDLAQKIWQTDEKLEKIQRWFNVNKIRDDKGLPVMPIENYLKKHQ